MLKFASYDIVFQEVPDEVSLAINISACPNHCPGCHSPHLQEDIGTPLDETVLADLLDTYQGAITCVCFMGGDIDSKAVEELAYFVKQQTGNHIKTAWYSGKPNLPQNCNLSYFDFIKLGPYIEKYGGLDSPSTNQKFYKIEGGKMIDYTANFYKK